MKLLVPQPYQPIAVDFMFDHPRCNLWAGMGMGKTVSSLMVVDALDMAGITSSPTLVLGPLRVASETWPEEPAKWEQYQHLKIVAICGTLAQRQKALRTKADIYTCNYEQLEWLVETLGASWPFRQVIADESTRLKGFRLMQGGKRAHALAKIAHQYVDRWINLTGTPAPNGLQDQWGQSWFIDRGKRLGRSFSAFGQRWFARNYNGFGLRPVGCADKEIKELLRDVTLTLDPKDWFDLKEPIVRAVEFELPPAARKVYDDLEKDYFAKVGDHNVDVFNAAALSQKCLQAASGAIYTTHPDWTVLHNAKLDALESIMEESGGMPLLVSYWFQSAQARLLKRFGKKCADLSTKDGMKQFKAGDAAMGIAHPKSLGHGYDGLQHVTNIMVNFDHTWDSELSRQIFERIGPVRQAQAEYERNVWVYNLIAKRTLDEVVIARNSGKVTVEEALRAYMKR